MARESPVVARAARRLASAPDRAFDAWLDPEMLGRWMFGPDVRDEEIIRLSIDPRVGGAFSFVVRRAGVEIDHVGELVEVDRPRRLAFTWGIRDETPEASRVVVEIAPRDGGCEVTVAHEMHPDWEQFASSTENAWAAMLAALAAALGEPKGGDDSSTKA